MYVCIYIYMYIYTYLKCANPTCQYYVHRLRLRKRLLAPLLGGVQICGSIRGKKKTQQIFLKPHDLLDLPLQMRNQSRPTGSTVLIDTVLHELLGSGGRVEHCGGLAQSHGSLNMTSKCSFDHHCHQQAWATFTQFHHISSIHPSIRPSIHPSIPGISTYCPFCRTSHAEVIGIVLLQPIRQPLDGIQALRLHLASQRHDFRAGTSMVGPWPEADTLYRYIDIYIYRPALSLYLCLFIYFIYSFIYIVISVCDYICIGKKRMLRISHEMKGNATNWTNHESFSAFYWNILEQFINHDGHPLGPQPPPLKKNLWCQEA